MPRTISRIDPTDDECRPLRRLPRSEREARILEHAARIARELPDAVATGDEPPAPPRRLPRRIWRRRKPVPAPFHLAGDSSSDSLF